MTRPGKLLSIPTLALLVAASACSTADEFFPPNGSVALAIEDSGLGSQARVSSAPLPAQVARWVVESASAQVEGVPEPFPFLGALPCAYVQNVLSLSNLFQQCAASGLVLATDGSRTVTVRLTISRLELDRADRPLLQAGGDYDGDGVPNDLDNCPIVANPSQVDDNLDGFGDACSDLDLVTQAPHVPDRDADGVVDLLDNCLWVQNPLTVGSQPDFNANGIGDDCERTARVLFPGGSLSIECDADFAVESSEVTFLIVDFDEAEAITCDEAFSTCTIDPTRITIGTSSDPLAAPRPCRAVP